MKNRGLMPTSSEYTSYAALAFSAISLLATYYYNQRSTKLSMLTEVFSQLFSDETRKNRYIVREHENEFLKLKHDPHHSLPREADEAGRFVASAYDRAGFFVSHNKNLTQEFLRWQGDVVLEMWAILGPWMEGPWYDSYLDSIKSRKPDATREVVSRAYTNYFEWLKNQAESREDAYFR